MIVLIITQSDFFKTSEVSKPLTIAVSKTPLSAPFFIAQEKSFFKEVGLNIIIKEVHGGKRVLPL